MNKNIIIFAAVVIVAVAAFMSSSLTGGQAYNRCSPMLDRYLECLEYASEMGVNQERCAPHWKVYEDCAAVEN